MKMTVGERISQLRNQKGYTLEYLADRLGMARQTIFKYENNIITNIPSTKIEEIASILQTTPSYLMGWDEESKKIEKPIDINLLDFSDVDIPIVDPIVAKDYIKRHHTVLHGGYVFDELSDNELIEMANKVRELRKVIRDIEAKKKR